ncbi:hypothetical protein L873DRAFT_1792888 [Choiromyces venosus 120613-1]|uniref:Uncharacterized protein n=1 Tax=Choiromyces venosus 120613-1 TaxID=1336337 RepID=A0A3N4JDC6_9PEZI|nr:hypothetical protein L873DRAFT_1792888 [Choiromyces venosus 120613-1]
MAAKLDPNWLVAMMSVAHRSWLGHSDFPIPDTIACIPTSSTKPQTIAVALQIGNEHDELRLVFSGNPTIDDSTVEHVKEVWGYLQALSQDYKKQATRSGNPTPVVTDTVRALKLVLFRDIYLFSIKKYMKGIEKCRRGFLNFTKKMCELQGDVTLKGVELYMYDTFITLDDREGSLSDDDWEVLCLQSLEADDQVRRVFRSGGGSGCEELAKRIHASSFSPTNMKSGADPFPLRHVLTKVCSFPKYFKDIIHLPYGPNPQDILRYRLSVAAVPEQSWVMASDIGMEIHNRARLQAREESTLATIRGRKADRNLPPRESTCALCTRGPTDPVPGNPAQQRLRLHPAVSYIGMSKRSCRGCQIWVESFNELDEREYSVLGASRDWKWVWPWAMPSRQDEDLRITVACKISDEYVAHQRLVGRAGEGFMDNLDERLQ